MTMTPIYRIPLEADSPTLHTIVRSEIDQKGSIALTDIMREACTHDSNDDSVSVMLDWAMQIRQELGYSWSECIDAAMILYYG
jgi:hypothetical protein